MDLPTSKYCTTEIDDRLANQLAYDMRKRGACRNDPKKGWNRRRIDQKTAIIKGLLLVLLLLQQCITKIGRIEVAMKGRTFR